MNLTMEERDQDARAAPRAGIVDCDIHPNMRASSELFPWLSRRWQQHIADFGAQTRVPFTTGTNYPKATPDTARRDAWPENGGPPGSDLALMRSQHLDANNVACGILMPLRMNGAAARNTDLGTALCAALNEWQVERWIAREPRLRAGVTIAHEDAEGAVAEIERRAGDRRFVQVQLPSKSIEPLGRKRYWPIFEAAERNNLPIAVHVQSYGGGYASTGGGWPSYYLQDHHINVHSFQVLISSLILEGVFDKFPRLRMVMVEGGFAWAPSLAWRLDKHWRHMRGELPHVKRKPSEYMREHIWFTTQPIEEPEQPDHLRDTLGWIGWDRVMFSTDYPHWDFDDPAHAFKIRMSAAERAAIFRGNAASLYDLE
jgi:predicted TIM-barrel fold metal-dependent hydrolase